MNKERARRRAEQRLEWAEKAERKAKEIYEGFQRTYGAFDWTEPIKIGHHSQRRHERMFERRDNTMRKIAELEAKAKEHREKAENLLSFANRNKGDAERERQTRREVADQFIKVGMMVDSGMYGIGIVARVNKKTYSMEFPSGFKTTVDKSWVRLLETNNN